MITGKAFASTKENRRGDTYRWWVVFMLWFVCFFNYADRQACR